MTTGQGGNGGGGGSSASSANCVGGNSGSNGGGATPCNGDVYFVSSDDLRTLLLTLPPGRTGRVKSVIVCDNTTTFEIELDPPKPAVCACGINRQDCEYHR